MNFDGFPEEVVTMIRSLQDAADRSVCPCARKRLEFTMMHAVFDGPSISPGLVRLFHDHHRPWCPADKTLPEAVQ